MDEQASIPEIVQGGGRGEPAGGPGSGGVGVPSLVGASGGAAGPGGIKNAVVVEGSGVAPSPEGGDAGKVKLPWVPRRRQKLFAKGNSLWKLRKTCGPAPRHISELKPGPWRKGRERKVRLAKEARAEKKALLRRAKGRPYTPASEMTPKARLLALARLDEAEATLLAQVEVLKQVDPFWWYEPSTGEVTADRREFLEKHLKPEDIPAVLIGQKQFHQSVAPVRGASGGNQAGKTIGCCIEGLIFATGQVPEKMKSWYPAEKLPPADLKVRMIRVVGENWEDGILKNVLPTWQKWVPREWLKDGDWKKSYQGEQAILTLYDPATKQPCAVIDFMSNVQPVGAFQGPRCDMIIYDEEPRWDIYKENLARFATAGKLNVVFGMTPTRGISWVRQELVDKFQDAEGRPVEWFKISTVVNPKANLATVALMVEQLSYQEKRMRLLGEFVSLSGLVYGGVWARAWHLIQPFPFWCTCTTKDGQEGWRAGGHLAECPWNHYIVYRGLDPHLVTNTACVWIAVDREERHYAGLGYFDDADTEKVKRDIFERSAKMRLGFSVCDSAADSDIKALGDRNVFRELQSGVFKIHRLKLASKGPNSIKPGVDQMKERLRNGTFMVMDIPELRPLTSAFETMERDRGLREEKTGPRDKILESKFHMHAATRYIEKYRLPWRYPGDTLVSVGGGVDYDDLEGNI